MSSEHPTDGHDEHAYVPGDDLPHHGPRLGEPKSPTWLPIVGILVFASMIVWWLSWPNDSERAAAEAAEKAAVEPRPGSSNEGAASAAAKPGAIGSFTQAPAAQLNPKLRPN